MPHPAPEGLLPFGDLVATHGIRGWLKLKPYNPRSTLLSCGREILLRKEGTEITHQVISSRPHKRLTLVRLEGINEINAAQPLVGSLVLVSKESLDPPSAGEYYYFQVVGFDVFDTGGHWIGRVREVWLKEGGDLYVVQGLSKEHLIPAVPEVIERVDLNSGKIIITPPAGLLEL